MLKLVFLSLVVLATAQVLKMKKSRDLDKKPEFVRRQATDPPCPEGKFHCQSGECIMMEWTCDNQFDCFDASDERDCPCECGGEHQFKCANGPCIPASHVCDKDDDCGDNSDELDCVEVPPTCGPWHVQCDNHRCVEPTWVCDGDDDCGDNSDEEDCGGTCNAHMFHCHSGDRCVPLTYRCDIVRDCPDGSDEINCECDYTTQVYCPGTGRCILIHWQCDGMDDCGDNSDESNCPTLHPSSCEDHISIRDCVLLNETTRPICIHDEYSFKFCRGTCNAYMFHCHSGDRCVPSTYRCDIVQDCPDGSDETNCGCDYTTQVYCPGTGR